MWNKFASAILNEDELEKARLKLGSLGLLIVALICAWVPHHQTTLWILHSVVSFVPDFVSGSLALAVIAPLYARRIIPYAHHSMHNILFFIVNLSVTATFIQIGLGKGSGFGTGPALLVVVCAIALTWLGIRAAAMIAWLVLLAYSVISTIFTNDGWGVGGFGFVVFGFCGILLQTPLNPHELFGEVVSEYAKRKPALPIPELVSL